jgi:hypothetical protein
MFSKFPTTIFPLVVENFERGDQLAAARKELDKAKGKLRES